MTKIEIVQSVVQTKQDLLDIQQFQIIGMFEELALEENILQYLSLLNRNGYMFYFKFKKGKLCFTGCNSEHRGGIFNETINDQYDMNVIRMAKQMLTDWHTKKQYVTDIRRNGRAWTLLCTCEHSPTTGIELTHQQRGVLTKILKMENKRKRLLVR